MKIKSSRRDIAFSVCNYAFFIALSICMVYPIWSQVCLSLSKSGAAQGLILWPKGWELAGYAAVFSSQYIWSAFGNSIIITVAAVILEIPIICGMAYFTTKKDVPGSKACMILVLFSFLFTGGMIPTYLVVKATGLMNTLAALVVPILFAPYNIIIIRNYMQSLPGELEESALIDGAGYFTIFSRIVMPLSKPIIATIAVWIMVAQWNNYMNALLYIHDQGKYILPLLVRDIVIGVSDSNRAEFSMVNSDVINAATIVIATVPILIVYPFMQKYFTKGIMVGAVKG